MTLPLELNLTDIAVKQVKKQLAARGRGVGLRIGTKNTGCSGLAYTLEFAEAADDTLHQRQFDTFVVMADEKTAAILRGATLDYVKKGLNAGFEFANPNEAARCGCGESFQI